MKKILLGTTTLIGAAALFAGVASADTPKVTIGGVADFDLGIVDEDNSTITGKRPDVMYSNTVITFRIDGKSDSGLGYGGGVDLEADTTNPSSAQNSAQSNNTNARQTFIYMDGGWGRVEMGSRVGAEATMKVDASSIARATGGIDGDWRYFVTNVGTRNFIATPDLPLNYGGSVNALGNANIENLNKITYYTPRFAGFQLGLSYISDDQNKGTSSGRSETNDHAQHIVTGGLTYENKWDQVGINLAATGEHGTASAISDASPSDDLDAWNAGAKLTWMGWSLAGSYGDWGNSLRTKSTSSWSDVNSYWTLGGAYDMGPFGASVTYLSSTTKNTSGANSDKFSNLSVGVDYKLAPGLTPYAEYNRVDFDSPGATNDNTANVFIVGSQLNF